MKIACDSVTVSSSSRTACCEKCATDYFFRQTGPGRPIPVACPRCGWFQRDMVTGLRVKRALSGSVLMALSGVIACLSVGHIGDLATPGAGGALLVLTGLVGSAAYFLADPNRGFRSGEGHTARADLSHGLPLAKLKPEQVVTPELLQTEVHRYLRRALVTMAGIDGYVEIEELEAIARLYYKVTGEDVLVRTLENEADEAKGQEKKLLNSLRCLSTCLDLEGKRSFVESLMEVAAADGRIDDSEIKLARDVSSALALPASEVKELVARVKVPASV